MSAPRPTWLLILLVLLPGAARSVAGTISPGLARQLADADPDASVRVLVVLRDQVDVAALDRELRTVKATRARRHAAVVGALQERARRSQAPLLADLQAAKAGGTVRAATPHWLINAVVVTATPAGVRALAARDDVRVVEADLVPELVAPVGAAVPAVRQPSGLGVQPGLRAVNAERVWRELGLDGTGVLVGLIDSGVDLTHPALAARWQGNFVPAAEAWRDVAGFGHDVPADLQGHGTHVAGIMTGLAPGDTIGVAPGARWIATNGIVAGAATFDNAIFASLEFMADPDGDPATTADVPDVVNNSWGISENFEGYVDCDSHWWDLIDNCEAAGVVLVWAAGNEGPVPGGIRSPADRADDPYNTFSVGATNHTAPFAVTGFSSRGPSGCGGVHQVKPEVCAPGDEIVSAQVGGGYVALNGTSMATPHVAGVIALMRQANPDLDVVTIKDILMTTARDLGPVGEDNDAGHGLIDAYAAVRAAVDGVGTVAGRVTDALSGQPLGGARITRDDGANFTVAAPDGVWSLTLYAGPAAFSATTFGYRPGGVAVTIPDGGTVAGDIALYPYPRAIVSGTVRGPYGAPVAGATVTAIGTPVAPATSDGAGNYALELPAGTGQPFTLRATAADLGYATAVIDVDGNVSRDFDLPVLTSEDFESGDFATFDWQPTGDFPWRIDTAVPFEGAYAARGADIVSGQSTGLLLDYYVATAGELSFWYKVSSEEGFDYLQLRIDGQVVAAWSGEIDWTRHVVPLAQGHHQLAWLYVKDPAVSAGDDTAWLDLIEFPVTGEELFPALDVGATSVAVSLPPSGSTTRPLVLTNTGGADLNFALTAAPIAQQAAAEGGPDAYGYTWTDSDDPDGPVFAWTDITTVGTPLPPADDFSYGPIDLGFPFVFYGTTYRSVRINTNGFLSFVSTSSEYENVPLPDPAPPNAVVAPFWDDLDPTAGGSVAWWADPANDRFVVQYTDVPRYGTAATITCQVELDGNGSVVFRYAGVGDGSGCTVGIENSAGDDGLTVLHDTSGYLRDGLAIRIAPPGFLPWVRVDPLAGVIPPGGRRTVALEFAAAGVDPGPHVAALTVTSDDPARPTAIVALVLDVVDASPVPDPDLPPRVVLTGAVPNPFNPRTEVRYALPAAAHVSLRIHDVRGRLVRVLVDERRPAGPQTAVWDGRDGAGRTVASGTYFARLVAAGEVRVARLALVR